MHKIHTISCTYSIVVSWEQYEYGMSYLLVHGLE